MMTELVPCLGNSNNKTFHNVAVVAIFRNEAHALREWIAHYARHGVEHFYLIDNNSDDNCRALLQPYQASGLVELFACPRDAYQIGAYMELLPLLRERVGWVGVFDLDEFIYPPLQKNFTTVLNEFAAASSVLIPWLSFGSNGHVHQPASIVESFTRRGNAACSRAFLKAFSRPQAVELLSQHNPTLHAGRKVLANGDVFGESPFILLPERRVQEFRLLNNHYRLQSLEYFTNVKSNRPEVNEEAREKRKSVSFFHEYDDMWSRVEDRRLANRNFQDTPIPVESAILSL